MSRGNLPSPNKRHSAAIVAEWRMKDYAAAPSMAIQLMCRVFRLSEEISFYGNAATSTLDEICWRRDVEGQSPEHAPEGIRRGDLRQQVGMAK